MPLLINNDFETVTTYKVKTYELCVLIRSSNTDDISRLVDAEILDVTDANEWKSLRRRLVSIYKARGFFRPKIVILSFKELGE